MKVKHWNGLLGAYNAIATKDSGTLYHVTDEMAIYRGSVCIVRSGNTLNTSSTAQTKAGALTVSGILTANGGLNATVGDFSGSLTANSMTIDNQSPVAHLTFTRTSYNYITATSGGMLCFVMNGLAISVPNSSLVIYANNVSAGANNAVSSGSTIARWSNLYSVLGNFSGLLTASAGIIATTSATTTIGFFTYGGPVSSAGGAGVHLGSVLPPTALGHRLGALVFGTTNGTVYGYNGALIGAYADGAWSIGSSHPTYITFDTCPVGSTARHEHMRIGSEGNVLIGTTSNPSSAKLMVNGVVAFTSNLTVGGSLVVAGSVTASSFYEA